MISSAGRRPFSAALTAADLESREITGNAPRTDVAEAGWRQRAGGASVRKSRLNPRIRSKHSGHLSQSAADECNPLTDIFEHV